MMWIQNLANFFAVSLQRKFILVMALAMTLLLAVTAFTSYQITTYLEAEANAKLETLNHALASENSIWLDFNTKALQNMVSLPGIVSMNPDEQKIILKAMAVTYSHMYLISTTDLKGINVARNDDANPTDYSDRDWFKQAVVGKPLTFQSLIGKTSGKPALVASVPIKDANGQIVGVGMFAANLTDITKQVEASKIGSTGYAYTIDNQNKVIAHPDANFTSTLQDISTYPPVVALRQGKQGLFTFTDENGVQWQASISQLDNGWGIIVQQQTSEFLSSLRTLQRISWFMVALEVLLLLIATFLTIRQVLQPIGMLTNTAIAITAGDMSQVAIVKGTDEIGILANTFNSMTAQLSQTLEGLEQRVKDRTADLEASKSLTEKHAKDLEAVADISRSVAAIQDLDELLPTIVRLISDRYGYYHTGIYLIDETGGYAILSAASSEGGQRMLKRQQTLPIEPSSLVGFVASRRQPRVAQDIERDIAYLADPDLPNTKSEAVLPLLAGTQLIGVLDVQSTQSDAFSGQDVNVLTTLANQIAVSVQNTRLFGETRRALAEAESVYQQYIQQGWKRIVRETPVLGYKYSQHGLTSLDTLGEAQQTGSVSSQDLNVATQNDQSTILSIPIKLREQAIGAISIRSTDLLPRELDEDELTIIQATVERAALALENARLLEDSQRRATRERVIGEISSKISEKSEIDAILRSTAEELGKKLKDAEVTVEISDITEK
jgi:GAF domain-containing protein/HAMP domain-containing protein